MRPEFQPEDVALVGEQVVGDVQPRHGRQVRADDPLDDERAHRGGLAGAMLEIVERGGADGEPLLVVLVPFRDLGIQVPAVVIEPGRIGDAADPVERLPFQLPESDDDVRHLDAGVVDVVLDFDRRVAEPQHADERVAERGVAQVTDVRGLVRIDGRVLDDRLRFVSPDRGNLAADSRQDEGRPFEEQVEEAVRRHVHPGHAGQGPEPCGELLRDGARRFFQRPRQLEGQRDREVAERAVRRHLYSERRQLRKVVLLPRGVGDRFVDLALDVKNHRGGRSVGKFVIRLQFVTNGSVESIGTRPAC